MLTYDHKIRVRYGKTGYHAHSLLVLQRFFSMLTLCTLLGGSVACSPTPQRKFDMQRELVSLGVQARQVSLNPSLLTPFLDESNTEEAALKHFLRTIREVQIYSIPSGKVLFQLAESARRTGYVREIDLRQGEHRMLVYTHSLSESDNISSLLILLFEPHNTYYAIDMKGVVSRQSMAQLHNISPSFFESYIRRFNIVF